MNLKFYYILITLLHITPFYAATVIPERSRKASIKETAHTIVAINEQIDIMTRLREQMRNPRSIHRTLQEIDILKTLRDLEINKLNNLRQ